MSYDRTKNALRDYAMIEYGNYRAIAEDLPYPSVARSDAWRRHELATEIYRAVMRSKSKSRKAALEICLRYVVKYRQSAFADVVKNCLEICRTGKSLTDSPI